MVNVYTEYFKELMDFLYGIVISLPDSMGVTNISYSFDDYRTSIGQQVQLLESLEKVGVLKIIYKVPLPPVVKFTLNTSGNRYSASGCLGYELEINKDEFLRYRANSSLLSVNNDEHQYELPHLSDNGRILFVNGDEIILSKHGEMTKSYAIYVEKVGGGILETSASYALFAVVYGLLMLVMGKLTDKVKYQELFIVAGFLYQGLVT